MNKNIETKLIELLNEFTSNTCNEEYIENGFYYMYYDDNEGPSSRGNDQDIYDDGFNAGYEQGRYDLINELLKFIKE